MAPWVLIVPAELSIWNVLPAFVILTPVEVNVPFKLRVPAKLSTLNLVPVTCSSLVETLPLVVVKLPALVVNPVVATTLFADNEPVVDNEPAVTEPEKVLLPVEVIAPAFVKLPKLSIVKLSAFKI